MSLTFFVRGTPAPQGSKRGLVVSGRVRLVEMSRRVKPWRRQVELAAIEAIRMTRGQMIRSGPVHVSLEFVLPRPKRMKHPACTVKPDIDKLTRAVLDALTGTVFRDDSQVVRLAVVKRFARESGIEGAGCLIGVAEGSHQTREDAL